MKIRANGIDIEVEDSGAGLGSGANVGTGATGQERPVVVLIMGLAMQLVAWPAPFVQALVDAGYRVIRFDNRDIGLSQHFDGVGTSNLLWAGLKLRLGLAVKSGYSLNDMALDTLGVMDALKIQKAHIVGVSMGGMIAQRVALAAPARVASLTSIMSTSGARGLPQASPQVMRALLSRPTSMSEQAIGDFYVKLIKVIGSPAFPVPEAEVRHRAWQAYKRGYHPQGINRQMMAIAADTGRASALKNIQVPTLVIHGKADALVPFAHGHDTHARIPRSKFVPIDGMGHDLPPGVLDRLLGAMVPHFQAA
jgi:pimeloyl-ACP methyl ester carboxylesterase